MNMGMRGVFGRGAAGALVAWVLAVSGCAGARYGEITDAERVAEGPGARAFEATGWGRVWVTDEDARAVVASRTMHEGDVVEIVPERGTVEAGGVPIASGMPSGDRRMAIYQRLAGPGWTPAPAAYGTVARDAAGVASGTGVLTWTAERAGRAWVGDDASRAVLVSRHVSAQDIVTVDPAGGEVRVNDAVVFTGAMDPARERSIFFR